MKDPVIPVLGLIIAFGVGLGIGMALGTNRYQPAPPQAIQPYDPARAICSDALKAAQDSQNACWSHLQDLLIAQRGQTAAPAGH